MKRRTLIECSAVCSLSDQREAAWMRATPLRPGHLGPGLPISANFQDAPALAPQQCYFAIEIKKARNTDNDDNAKFCIL